MPLYALHDNYINPPTQGHKLETHAFSNTLKFRWQIKHNPLSKNWGLKTKLCVHAQKTLWHERVQ